MDERAEEIRERLSRIASPIALLEGIFAHAPIPLQIYDTSGRSILTNRAFRDLFGSEPPPDDSVVDDEIAQQNGVQQLIHRAFAGETIAIPATWYDPRELRKVSVAEGKRVAIETLFFPLIVDGAVTHVGVVFKDVTPERTAREEVAAERDLLRLIIEQTGDGVIVADADGVIRVFNAAAQRQHGVARAEVHAPEWASAYGLFRDDGTPLPLDETPLYRALRGEKVEDASWTVKAPSGERRLLNGTATPLRAPDRSLAGAVLVTRDETERRAREDERATLLVREQAARTAAEEANRAKDEFLALLGHELRNPLAPIITALDLIDLRRTESPSREMDVIRRQVDHLARLVDDLLDVSRITRGQVELRLAATDLGAAVERALEMASPMLEQHGHHVTSRVAPGLTVRADAARLAQVFSNLLTNAARYTPPGGHIDVHGAREADEIVVAVTDDGIGIEPELLPRIFDIFVQGGARSRSRAVGGLGLGLALVKSLMALHGGGVTAESDGPGHGTRFVVRLPAADATAPESVRMRPLAASVARKRVLIVDDNADAAELLATAFELAGHEVRVAYDGAQALAAAADFDPEVAVLDLGLPVLDGYELGRRLRASHPSLSMIALSGYARDADRARTEEAGFDRHFAKPVDLATLLSSLDPP